LTRLGWRVQPRLGKLLAFAERMGIDRLCVSMGMEFTEDPSPERLRRDHSEVLHALRRFPKRVFGLVYLNPRHRQASLDELNRCVRDGPI
jgi:uncharacterized protein